MRVFSSPFRLAFIVFMMTLLLSNASSAQVPNNLSIRGSSSDIKADNLLYSFQGSDGFAPEFGSVIFDRLGNLYGTTAGGGAFNSGTVFELIRPATVSGVWTEAVLYSFQGGSDGKVPESGLVMDRKGNLYGTTLEGGETFTCPDTSIVGCGIAFELSPPAVAGDAWTETILYVFQGGSDAGLPYAGFAMDKAGNLYGTSTAGGGTLLCGTIYVGCGTVFQLARPTVSGGAWTKTILHAFEGGADGSNPYDRLIFDAQGNLYGTTSVGGNGNAACYQGCGTVFQLMPPTTKGGAWIETVLYSFTWGSDGYAPISGLTFDQSGNLYGVTAEGGNGNGSCNNNGCGTVYELSPPSVPGAPWTEAVLHAFQGGSNQSGADGWLPYGDLVLDQAGNLYGTTLYGGRNCSYLKSGCGIIFQLVPPTTGGGAWTEHVLHAFYDNNANDGYSPLSGLTFGPSGFLYGTTGSGGAHYDGTVFRISP